jgi:hypothetical protein
MRLWNVFFVALLGTITLSLSSCLVDGVPIGDDSGSKAVVDPNDNPGAFNRLICDPFHTNSQLARERGFFGNIYYIPDTSICHGGPNPGSGSNNSGSDESGGGNSSDNGNSGSNGNGNSNSGGSSHGNGHHKVGSLSEDEGDDEGGACFKNVEEYIQKGTLVDAYLYLDRLFVQSQPFTNGIVDDKGNTIDLAGVKFYENFAVDMHAYLQLGSAEQPGLYQLALISDDGALLKRVDENGNEVILVNNNGSHPTQMACGDEPIYMDRNTKIPIKLQQFQGSRKNITMIAMWRPYDPNNSDATSLCGKRGNGYFFDSTKTPIQPKKPFYDLLLNNWKVLTNENFQFPSQEDNPCAPKEATLLMSGFNRDSLTRNSVTVSWTTNIPASSQLEIKNLTTGATYRTALDVTLSTSHHMTALDLSPFTLYSVRAISTTPGGQTVQSDENAFRTAR